MVHLVDEFFDRGVYNISDIFMKKLRSSENPFIISVEYGIIRSISFEVDKSETISTSSYGSSKTRGKVTYS